MVHYNFDLQYTSENINYNLFLPTKIKKKKKTYWCIFLIIKSNCHGIDILDFLYFFTKDTIDIFFLMSIKEDFIENAVWSVNY